MSCELRNQSRSEMTTITAASKTTRGHELAFSVASIIEDVLHQHGSHSSHLGLSSRRMDEVSMRRYEAAGWLRKTMGVVGGKDLAAEPSEEEFMLALRSGIILCSVLNKLTPGAIPKVVEGPSDCVMIPEGAPLSAFQYFENIRNFLVAVHEMGLPSFEASDLEQGGKSARVVNCVLALKSYSLWKQTGSNGSWKLGSPSVGRPFMRKNSDPFFNTLSWGDPSPTPDFVTQSPSARSLNALVHEVLSDKRQEEVPLIIESMLSKVVEEFERRLANQTDLKKAIPKDISLCNADRSLSKSGSEDEEIESRNTSQGNTQEEGSKCLSLKQHVLVEQQQRDIENLKHTLRDTKGVVQFLQRQQKEEFDNLGKHLQGLACAASGYQRVVEENRKLYNQVQDLKGSFSETKSSKQVFLYEEGFIHLSQETSECTAE